MHFKRSSVRWWPFFRGVGALRVASQTLGLWYDGPDVSEVILNETGKIDRSTPH